MSNALRDMRESKLRLVTEARAKLDEVTEKTDEARAAEIEGEFDKMMAEVDKIDARIAREEKLAKAKADLEAVDKRRRPNMADGDSEAAGDDEAAVSYRDAFHQYLSAQGQVGALDPDVRAVLRAGYAKVDVPKDVRAQTVGTDNAGGYTVPEEMQNILIRSMRAWGPMYEENVCTVINTAGGNPLVMPTIDDTSQTGGPSTEGATLTDDGGADVVFGPKSLGAFSFDTEWVRCSLELAQDSIFAMENLLGDLLGERLARLANTYLTTGTGSGQPNGIATAATTGATAVGTAAVTWDELLNLEHSVDPAYRVGPKVAYMFNDATLLALRKLKDGDGNYIWQAGNVQSGVPNTINGRPYHINQAMPGLAAGQDAILFGDLSKYYVRKVGAPLIGALQDKDFWPGFGVAGYIRFDGELADAGAIKALTTAAA